MGTQNSILDSVRDVSLPDRLRTSSLLRSQACNLAYNQTGKERKLQLQELEELCLEAYENSWIYKQKVHSILDGIDHLLSLIFFPMVNGHHLKEFHELSTLTMGEVESISLVELPMSDDTPLAKPHNPPYANSWNVSTQKKRLDPEGTVPTKLISSQLSPTSRLKSL
ncbi:hypothetical protein CR513_05401, partial [Mucuna pruriens]